MNKLEKVLKAEIISISLLYPLLFYFKNNKKKINKLYSQIIFWNKGGLKLFLFQEYRP